MFKVGDRLERIKDFPNSAFIIPLGAKATIREVKDGFYVLEYDNNLDNKRITYLAPQLQTLFRKITDDLTPSEENSLCAKL